MQLHVIEEIQAADMCGFRATTGGTYDKAITKIQKAFNTSDEDWDDELVSSVEIMLNDFYPGLLVSGQYNEGEGYATWTLFAIPDALSNIVETITEYPFSEMPLLVNHPVKPIAELAKWRLKIGV